MKVSDNVFPKLIFVEGSAPATPSSGQIVVYAKTDGLLYYKDDTGAEELLGGGGGGGGGATDFDSAFEGVGATFSPYLSSSPTIASITNSGRDSENVSGSIANMVSSQIIVPALAYFEIEVLAFSSPGYSGPGIVAAMKPLREASFNYVGGTADTWSYWSNGSTYTNNVQTSGAATFGAGDIIGVAVNRTDGKLWFSKNASWLGSGNPAAGSGAQYSSNSLKEFMRAGCTTQNAGNKVRLRGTAAQLSASPPAGFSAAFSA